MNNNQILKNQPKNDNSLLLLDSKINLKEKQKLIQAKQEFKNLLRRQSLGRLYNSELMNKEQRIKTLFGILQKTCEILELKLSSFILTVHIFDATISKFPVSDEDMLRVGMVAMQLAAKINESNQNIISYDDLAEYILPGDVKEYKKIEQIICINLDFKFNIISPNSILVFLLNEFFKTKYNFFGSNENISEKKKKFIELAFDLHLITLVEYEFYQYTSLAVAVSILILTRNLFGLDPWTHQMKKFVKCSKFDVKECLIILFDLYKSNYVSKMFKKIDTSYQEQKDQLKTNNLNNSISSLVKNSSEYVLSHKKINKYIYSGDTDISTNKEE